VSTLWYSKPVFDEEGNLSVVLDYEVVDTSLLYDVGFGVLNVDMETGMNINILNSIPCTYESENDALCGDFKDTVIFGETESLGGGQMITA
jgi:hypothetical protein